MQGYSAVSQARIADNRPHWSGWKAEENSEQHLDLRSHVSQTSFESKWDCHAPRHTLKYTLVQASSNGASTPIFRTIQWWPGSSSQALQVHSTWFWSSIHDRLSMTSSPEGLVTPCTGFIRAHWWPGPCTPMSWYNIASQVSLTLLRDRFTHRWFA
jgi:hypothetical protein